MPKMDTTKYGLTEEDYEARIAEMGNLIERQRKTIQELQKVNATLLDGHHGLTLAYVGERLKQLEQSLGKIVERQREQYRMHQSFEQRLSSLEGRERC